MKLTQLQSGAYIVAVSGGVDSIVLLDLLCKQTDLKLIVAHFDHGIRSDSATDSQFVNKLADKYNLPFELGSAKLGKDASEEQARNARYSFLHEIKDKYNARQIITAHHSDDIVETIIINLTRGTGWRGISSLRSTEHVLRPLLDFTKADILAYAKDNNIEWVEDSTNQDLKYLRNEIRHKIVTKMNADKRAEFLHLYQSQMALADQIDAHTSELSSDKRHDFIMWPESVSIEVLRSQLKLTRPQARRALTAIKTAKPGTKFEIDGDKSLEFTHKNIVAVVK
jgi:tRNA(Ile)-lysidine synthase